MNLLGVKSFVPSSTLKMGRRKKNKRPPMSRKGMKELREPTIKASRQEVNALIHLNSCKSTQLEKDSRLYLLWRLSLGTILGGTTAGQVAASREGAASHGLVAHAAPLTHSMHCWLPLRCTLHLLLLNPCVALYSPLHSAPATAPNSLLAAIT